MNMDIDKNIYKLNEEEESENDKEEKELISPSMRLLKSRQIVLSDAITSKVADRIMKKLLLMNNKDKDKAITIIINSPGGEIYSGFGIFDMIRFIEAPVRTVICGLAASMGSIISLAADKEHRYATSNSKIMIHQPLLSGLMGGPITDIEIEANEMMKVKQKIVDLYVEATNKPEKEIRKTIERNTWMTAKEAKDFGLVTKIISSISEIDS